MPKIVDRSARRAELASAAAAVFADRGVANATVSDIVRAAGVAQGTFYLYFDSKDEVVLAVAELMTSGMIDAIESAVVATDATAVEKLLALRDVLCGFDNDPSAIDLSDFIHRPENRALHDRLTENIAVSMVALVESIITQGVSEGVFDVADPHAAAWFVGAGLQSVELAGTPATEMGAAFDTVIQLALRALGHEGAVS